ncbi:MAG: tryptophan--tRNA ligase [Candidatus Gastranaerophilales bacterium]|nr:tryptophan--tRNA ligase [Candidatus Gastranaerophilales bacterium]
MMEKVNLVSGMRSTGKLHLGHYMGVITNWVKLQEEYNCFYFVADWHALTTKYDKTENLRQDRIDVVIDWLACGINPDKSTVYFQSKVPQIAELHILLSMITPNNWVERDPTLKDMVKILKNNDSENNENIPQMSYGLLGYPVLMSADIMAMNAEIVPVGVDQLAHLEITRDIARRFNNIYKTNLFNEPKPKLTEIPLLLGVDGQKMGKSFHNDIKISDNEETTSKKIMQCITDRSRARKEDYGHPDKCEVAFKYYQVFSDEETVKQVETECKAGQRGCVDCKRQLGCIINQKFAPIREKRMEYQKNIEQVYDIINEGSKKAAKEAESIMKKVRDAVNI